MGKKKSLNLMGIVFLCVAVVALVLAIVGMVTPALIAKDLPIVGDVNVKLFGNDEKVFNWENITKATKASPTLSIVGFIVAIVGALVVVCHLVLKLFVGKDIKILGICGGVVALVGGVLVLVGGIVMASNLNTLGGTVDNTKMYSLAIGTILGLISGIVGAAAGVVSSVLVK
ncbi:MAG: hypothetical protein J1G04_02335 [Clostridiales bacterium]|nr:hypothetical protein [Clostridiales bacterium]